MWEKIVYAAERFGALAAPWREGAFASLAAAPAAAFLVACAVFCGAKGKRGASKRWYLYFSAACEALLCALALAAGEDVRPAAAAALASFALSLPLYGLLTLFGKKKEKKAPPVFREEEEEPPALPRKVCCFGDVPRGKMPIGDVRMDYALSVAERLRAMPLGAGDRLEADKMCELLHIYKDKAALSGEECGALNDILASLLKMLAKYGG